MVDNSIDKSKYYFFHLDLLKPENIPDVFQSTKSVLLQLSRRQIGVVWRIEHYLLIKIEISHLDHQSAHFSRPGPLLEQLKKRRRKIYIKVCVF
ncbi:hypothetical protein [Coxiella endosymbiont of Ornithodoros maritimus]|uniref:hypothetical protein n=1 Tax=Coxiella endosymbiont of Ornithodoros maritimus TaxID=1656172 RepID=UPI0022643436|nr:hypothetical protein [Coxiella endosymbiont of Ornithodoros maritimus]